MSPADPHFKAGPPEGEGSSPETPSAETPSAEAASSQETSEVAAPLEEVGPLEEVTPEEDSVSASLEETAVAKTTAVEKASEAAETADLEALRSLLIAPERSALTDLRRRLDTPAVRTREMASYLPEAILLRNGDDEKLGRALRPTVEQALKQSVRSNPQQIVDAIFPVMGPAIRRAIVSTLMGMIQSFNKVIDHTFTLRGIRWRIEAVTSGRSFAEVVLLNTLIYQVEQIYLIHRPTGLVLEHVVPHNAISQDPDLISSMLTAIQDFVRDSFSAHGDESLNTLRMGSDRSIWIEQSPKIGLAAVIRGTPPVDLRTQMREILESIQITHATQIDTFEGDQGGFADLHPRLDACLQARFHVEERRLSPLTLIILLVLVGALVAGGFWHLKREQRWHAFLDRLNDQSGVVVTRVEKKNGVHHIFGLRDPLAVSPQEMLAAADLPSHKVVWHWRAYYDLAPEMVLARIHERLNPPKSVHLDLEGERLLIQGFARNNWIVAARQALAGMPAVVAVDSSGLKDLDLIEAQAGADRLAAKAIYFSIGAFEIDTDNADVLVDVVATIRRLTALSRDTGIEIFISILGHTDESGTRQKNLMLGQRRAEVVREHLIHQGIPAHHLQAIGVSMRAMDGQPSPSNHPDLSRSVTFQVAING
jgi:outer membrane protein OmpA-like peptidoglycan-associated protein